MQNDDGNAPGARPRIRARMLAAPKIVSRIGHRIDRIVATAGALRPGFFVWPVLIGFGLGLGSYGIAVPEFANAVLKPRATLAHVGPGLSAALVGVAVTVVALCFAALHARRSKDARSFADVWRLNCSRAAALATLPLVVSLSARMEGHRPWLTLTFCALAGAATTFSAFHFGSAEGPPGPSLKHARVAAGITLGAMVAAYAVVFSVLTIKNHLAFNTGRADLGIYVNIFRQSSLGTFLGCSLCGDDIHYTGGHFDPLLAVLSPLYWLYPFAENILALQATWLALGAIPVYLLANHHVGHRGAALALAFSYLAYPAVHGINCYDFHSLALCVPPLLLLLYCLEIGAPRAYAITLLVTLLVREDLPLALVGVGLYSVFSGKKHGPRYGWVTLLVSVSYFVFVKAVIMGRPDPLNASANAAGYASFYSQLTPGSSSTRGLVGTVLTDPAFVLGVVFTEAKATYLALLLVPLFGLPLFGRGRIMLGYGAALTLLATRPYLPTVHFHYSSALVPFIFALTASALGRIRSSERLFGGDLRARSAALAVALGIAVTTTLASWKFGAVIPNQTFLGGFRPLARHPSSEQLAQAAWLKELSATIPRDAAVAANSRLVTHLGETKTVYLLNRRIEADYVVYKAPGKDSLRRAIEKEIELGYLVLEKTAHGVKVLRTAYPKDFKEQSGERAKAPPTPRRKHSKRKSAAPAPPPPEEGQLDEE